MIEQSELTIMINVDNSLTSRWGLMKCYLFSFSLLPLSYLLYKFFLYSTIFAVFDSGQTDIHGGIKLENNLIKIRLHIGFIFS